MPKFKTQGIEELSEKFDKLGHRAEGIAKASLYEGANVLADAIRASGVSNGVSQKVLDGLYVAEFKTGAGSVQTEIGFAGYFTNENGKEVPRALVAATFESGTSNRQYPKTRFISKGFYANRKRADSAISSEFDKRFNEIMGE